jgi:NAD(P)-dependent dehydrogenase (short-subunit alcohol dehydrogenase family)
VVADLSEASECQRVVQETIQQFGGVDMLVNNVGVQPNASVQGLQSQRRAPAYAASKGGVLSLTRQMALDYAAVVVLASDAASFMTGEYVCVDGGLMALGAWAGGAADER